MVSSLGERYIASFPIFPLPSPSTIRWLHTALKSKPTFCQFHFDKKYKSKYKVTHFNYGSAKLNTKKVEDHFTWRHGGHVSVHNNSEKKSFGSLILLLCKTWATFCNCFVHQHGRLITWVKTKNRPFAANDHMVQYPPCPAWRILNHVIASCKRPIQLDECPLQ